MHRIYNFSAGPAALPEAVLCKARDELLAWNQEGASVMEISHRGKAFNALTDNIEANFRKLLKVPQDYHVLFLHGGATGQFAAVPMNLIGQGKADYAVTGHWGKKAYKEAQKYGDIALATNGESQGFTTIDDFDSWSIRKDASYLHITPNETIAGLEFDALPQTSVPIVADMSSTLLSRPIEVEKYGLIYAGAQKNMGQAGITVVIVRDDLLSKALPITPSIFDYQKQKEEQSKLNTPATFAWYLSGLVVDWVLAEGGLEAMGVKNQAKAEKLYHAIDESHFYHNPVDKQYRSWMNVIFTLKNSELDSQFLKESEAAGLYALKGHRSVGGMRASLYNAVSEEAVDALIAFMKQFEQKYA